MDGKHFDAVTQGMTEAPSRRRLLTGLLGGASLLTGALALSDAEAQKGKGKAKGKGKGKNNGNGKGKGRTKVTICHKGQVKTVAQPALKGHLKHGDFACGEPGVCQTGAPTDCDTTTRTCAFDPVPDEDQVTCIIVDDEGNEVPGTCLGGECVPA